MYGFDYLLDYFSEKLKNEIAILDQRIPSRLYEPISYSLNMGGKRIRPVLTLMAYNIYKPDIDSVLPIAFAIELFHNFTLLHDDIMDNADLRRCKETVHIRYSNNAAILSGDAMSILSYEYLARCNSENLHGILELFTQTALKICEGQQFDMDFETSNTISVDDYISMIGLKTAVLLAASLKLGAMAACAPADDLQCLYEFGYNLGLAFQLQDDLLDTFGNKEEFGKNIGGDIVANKKTYLLLTALQLANQDQANELNKWIASTAFNRDEKICAVKKIFSDLSVDKITRQKVDFYFNLANNWWHKLNIADDKKKVLIDVANLLMNRRK